MKIAIKLILLNSLLNGSIAIIAPIKPIIVAVYLLQLTFSFKKITDPIVNTKGVKKMILYIVVSGSLFIQRKNNPIEIIKVIALTR